MSAAIEDLENEDPTRESDEPNEQSAEGAPLTSEEGEEDQQESAADRPGEPDRKSDFNRRYAQERARRARAEEQAAYWRDQALRKQVEQGTAPPADAAAEPEDPEPTPPNPDDFDGDIERLAKAQTAYLKEAREWDKRQAQKTAEAERKAAEQREQNARLTEHQQKQVSMIEKGREAHEDFDDVALDPGLPISSEMLDIMTDMDNGTEVFYALGKQPAEAKRIYGLSGREAILAMATFAASVGTQAAPGKKGSGAPPPPNPARGGGDQAAVDEDKLSTAEAIKRDRERRAKQGRRS